MDAVEVDRVRVRGAVGERDPQPLALAAAQRRPGDPPVVGPGGELHARHDLDLLVDRVQLPRAHDAPGGGPRRRAPVEVAHDLVRVEPVGDVVDRDAAAEVRVPAVLVPVLLRVLRGVSRRPARTRASSAPPARPAPISPRRVSDATATNCDTSNFVSCNSHARRQRRPRRLAAIFHGAPAPDAPWFVSLEHGPAVLRGALIAPDRVLTAAHCVQGAGPSDFQAASAARLRDVARRLLPAQLPDHPVARRPGQPTARRPRSTTSR